MSLTGVDAKRDVIETSNVRTPSGATPYQAHPECACGRPVYREGRCKRCDDLSFYREQLAAERSAS